MFMYLIKQKYMYMRCNKISLNDFFYPVQYIPMPVLYGVFFYMGFSALRGMQVCNNLDFLF